MQRTTTTTNGAGLRRLGQAGGRVLVAATVLVVATLALAAPSRADEYGRYTSNGFGEVPNGPEHSYCFRDVASADHRARIHGAMGVLDDQTVMSAVFYPTCTATTDIAWVVTPLCTTSATTGCPYLGLTTCETIVKWWLTGVCDRNQIHVDLAVLDHSAALFGATVGDPSYDLTLSQTMCHEVGHTVGVQHYIDESGIGPQWGCMGTGWITATGTLADWAYVSYIPHHVEHIDTCIQSGLVPCASVPA